MLDSQIAIWLRTSLAYPVLETLHIAGLATLFGSILIVDLRLLGRLRRLDAAALMAAVLPWTLTGFLLAAATGMTMFYARASELITNPVFAIKICLVLLAGINAGVLHARGLHENFASRLQAGLSILIWIAVIVCGRWIAYV